jgi:hypothetical protein
MYSLEMCLSKLINRYSSLSETLQRPEGSQRSCSCAEGRVESDQQSEEHKNLAGFSDLNKNTTRYGDTLSIIKSRGWFDVLLYIQQIMAGYSKETEREILELKSGTKKLNSEKFMGEGNFRYETKLRDGTHLLVFHSNELEFDQSTLLCWYKSMRVQTFDFYTKKSDEYVRNKLVDSLIFKDENVSQLVPIITFLLSKTNSTWIRSVHLDIVHKSRYDIRIVLETD